MLILASFMPQWLPDLYSEEIQNEYADRIIWKQQSTTTTQQPTWEPHIYETSSNAYLNLATKRQDQTIITTGILGAGKSTSNKILLTHLSVLEMTAPSRGDNDSSFNRLSFLDRSEVVTKIIESNPILEAFGNAETTWNYNSSRFGKVQRLQFDVRKNGADEHGSVPIARMTGSCCETYLLEKTRVTEHSVGERGFHIFYQLLSSPESFRREVWKDGFVVQERMAIDSDFLYLATSSDVTVTKTIDTKNWNTTVRALELFGIVGDELRSIVRALCAVLQLGNISFATNASPECDSSYVSASPSEFTMLSSLLGVSESTLEVAAGPTAYGASILVSSPLDLTKLANLLGVPESTLEAAFTQQTVNIKGLTATKKLRVRTAKDICEVFAREIYCRIFEYVVNRMNDATDATRNCSPEGAIQLSCVNLLDFFGFENFRVNRFEQLYINYASERIKNRYITDKFKVIEEYLSEGIHEFRDHRVAGNSDVLDLLDGRIGVIVALNEECIRHNGSNNTFVYKVKVVHESHPSLVSDRLFAKNQFAIRHYSGDVKYTADSMMVRNLDCLPQSLIDIGCQSSNHVIQSEFRRLKATMSANHETPKQKTVLSKFRSQLNNLMTYLDRTRIHYICCIKPNNTKKPQTTNQRETATQLESASLVAAALISRENLSKSLSHIDVLERFGILCHDNVQSVIKKSDNKKRECLEYILRVMLPMDSNAGRHKYPWRITKSKVFFKAGALEQMESVLDSYVKSFAVRIQAWIRRILSRQTYLFMKHNATKIQSVHRGNAARASYRMQIDKVLNIQCIFRRAIAQNSLQKLRKDHAATTVSCQWRAYHCTQVFRRKLSATRKIQQLVRCGRSKNLLLSTMAEVVQAARTEATRLQMQKQIHDATKSSSPDGEQSFESIYDHILEEIAELRSKNCSLSQQLQDSKATYRAQESRMLTAQSEVLVANSKSNRLSVLDQVHTAEAIKRRAQILLMRAEHKAAIQRAEEDKKDIAERYESELRQRDANISTLKSLLSSEQTKRSVEGVQWKSKHEEMEEKYESQILELKQKLRDAQVSPVIALWCLFHVDNTT